MIDHLLSPFRSAVLGALLAVAALPAAAQAPEDRKSEKELYEAAKKEGELVWYTAHYSAETAEDVADAFEKKYPGIDAKVVRTTAQVAYQRLMQDLMNQAPVADVFSSTDVGHYVHLKKEDRLAKYAPPNIDKLSKAFQGLDSDGYYYPTSGGLVLITYNKQAVSEAEAPKNWPDLLDPKWKGKVSVGHPAFSGYVGTWVVLMDKLYGWDYFEKLEKNDPQIGRSVNDTVTMLNAGEAAVAAGPEATTARSAARGNPLGMIYPTDGALLMVSPSAVMANAPHPNAARLFMNFLMGPEHAKVVVANYGTPVIEGIEPAPGTRPLSEIKTVRPTVEEIVEGIPRVIEEWRDTFLE